MSKQNHSFGETLGTIPDVKCCGRCGKYVEIEGTRGAIIDDFGTAHLSDLPREIWTNMAGIYCDAKLEYTQYQLDKSVDNAYRDGWFDGQQSGIGLQPEFSQQFFSKIRLNPDTLLYEIPQESYAILKQKIAIDVPLTKAKETK